MTDFLVDTWSTVLEKRKISVQGILEKTIEGLQNSMASDESPEELIFNLFKLPNKEEASIGKLLTVGFFCRKDGPLFEDFPDHYKEVRFSSASPKKVFKKFLPFVGVSLNDLGQKIFFKIRSPSSFIRTRRTLSLYRRTPLCLCRTKPGLYRFSKTMDCKKMTRACCR